MVIAVSQVLPVHLVLRETKDPRDEGETKETGKQGITGPVGPKGDAGLKGQKGDMAPAGMPGAKGEPGESISALSVAVSPKTLTVNEGGSGSFQCSVSGNPKPAIKWIKTQGYKATGDPQPVIS